MSDAQNITSAVAEPVAIIWRDLVPRLDNDALDACFFDSLGDGTDDVTEAILAEYERRGREPG